MDKLAKVRVEAERLIKSRGMDFAEDALYDLLDFIKPLEEEPVSEDMWEASKQYALRQVLASTDTEMSEQAYLDLRLFSGLELAIAHKDGANWQKEQMMKEAINAVVESDLDPHGADYGLQKIKIEYMKLESLRFKPNTPVKIIILKED